MIKKGEIKKSGVISYLEINSLNCREGRRGEGGRRGGSEIEEVTVGIGRAVFVVMRGSLHKLLQVIHF